MSDFLTAVSTRKAASSAPLVQEVQNLNVKGIKGIDSLDSLLKALKSQPDRISLDRVLNYLSSPGRSLVLPEPVNASIVYQLVNDTVPNYWSQLGDSQQAEQLAHVLRNPTGLGHIITRLRSLVVSNQQKKLGDQLRDFSEHIQDILGLLERILQDDGFSIAILDNILRQGKHATQKRLLWKEYLAQVTSGRIVSTAAEAENSTKDKGKAASRSWLSNGSTYAAWLGRNLIAAASHSSIEDEYVSYVVELYSKSLNLGYNDELIDSIISKLGSNQRCSILAEILSKLKAFEQNKYLNAILTCMSKRYLDSDAVTYEDEPLKESKTITGTAFILHAIVKGNEGLRGHLINLLTRSSIASITDSLALRRVIIVTLAQDNDSLHSLLENAFKLFGDSMYIKHTPILQQESLAQTLAICSGYVQRTHPMYLTMMAKSSHHVNGMSNRIGASSLRARFLGIAVGTAISKMVDKPEFQLKFDLEGMEQVEATWYERLMEVDDKIGSISDLVNSKKSLSTGKKAQKEVVNPSRPLKTSNNDNQGRRVVEILSDTEDEDDDLIAYGKPDSDPEDEDEDPTNINRNKATTPVYIRDLISGLRDQENYERHELALSTAPALIRRKANFGSEVTDHLEELATVLTGLQDNLELEGFSQKRQQALIAVLLTRPVEMAQWFARSFFGGDYSLTQRIAMLTTMGLGARELAGMNDAAQEELLPLATNFPSKKLPPHLHKIYAENKDTNPVARISSSMAREMLSPIASQAADQLSGPNVLKVRTFSSRMEVEKKRQKPIPNALAKIVADNFFFPLTGRWWIQIRGNSDSIYSSAHLLPSFLQTLSLLMNASGPNTLALPQMTKEFWDLLLSVRGLATKDKQILNALLFGFMMLLETNEDKERLATEQGKELMETQSWVQMVFRDLGGGSEEDERVRVLAAGVIVRCQEVVEKYQRRLAGAMMDY